MDEKPFSASSYSVFTPFLRRFTDERARDLADTIALYHEVKKAYLTSVWSHSKAMTVFGAYVVETVSEAVEFPDLPDLAAAFIRCQNEILSLETTVFTFPDINWDTAVLSLREQVDLRRFLRAKQHFLANSDRNSDLLASTLATLLAGIAQELPQLPGGADTSPFTVPFISFVADPGALIERITGTVFAQQMMEAGLFTSLQMSMWANLCTASGLLPESEPRKPLITARDAKLSPVALAETYLAGTPFLDLLLSPVPFSIPEEIRFEHMHIVAGSGHGKTQTLQHLIAHDLLRDPEHAPGMVVIDSQGDLLSKIMRLDLFHRDHGTLADRLVIIDPTDVEHPPALGLFDLNLSRMQGYDRRSREQIMNGVIDLYDYIFGGLIGAELTQKQNVIFRYLARLMLVIPDATILTLKEVMYDSAPFAQYFDQLEGRAREFFLYEFGDRQYSETKKQVLRRLWGVLENPTFERLFSHPRNKLDMFDALNSGKIVLVNTAKDFLKAERSSILGRFFIALAFHAALERAALPEYARRPAFLYIDEAADYFDGTIDSLLTQARKFRFGVVFAHQYLDQLPQNLEASIMANTSIKFAGGVSSSDAHALARNMATTSEFIQKVKKRRTETDFAAYIRNVTDNAVTLTVPFGTIESLPRMPADSIAQIIDRNRARYASRPDDHPPVTAHLAPPPHAPTSPDKPSLAAPRRDSTRPTTTKPKSPPATRERPKPTAPPPGAEDDDWRS